MNSYNTVDFDLKGAIKRNKILVFNTIFLHTVKY